MREKRTARAKQAAEKGNHSAQTQEKRTAGAEAHVDFAVFASRLKSCPDTVLLRTCAKGSFSCSLLGPLDCLAYALRNHPRNLLGPDKGVRRESRETSVLSRNRELLRVTHALLFNRRH